MTDPFMSAFFGANANGTWQSQDNDTTVSGTGGDVSVANAQLNATSQDISGLGINLGGEEGGTMYGFEAYNSNYTSQYQDNDTSISGTGGDVSVLNVQGNATDQSISGAGVNVDDLGFA